MHTFQDNARRAIILGGYSVADENERIEWFLRKAVDLALACGFDPQNLAAFVASRVEYVAREGKVATRAQELGGVMVTAAGVAIAFGLDAIACGETEAQRIVTKRQLGAASAEPTSPPPCFTPLSADVLTERIIKVKDVHAIAMTPGNAHANHYMRGMANGLELAMAILEERDVAYVGPEAVEEGLLSHNPDHDERKIDPDYLEVDGGGPKDQFSDLGPSDDDERRAAEAPLTATDVRQMQEERLVPRQGDLAEAGIEAIEKGPEDQPAPFADGLSGMAGETDGDFLRRIGTDAERWAEEFAKRFGGRPWSHDDLRAWFANAIEAGRSAGYADGRENANTGAPV